MWPRLGASRRNVSTRGYTHDAHTERSKLALTTTRAMAQHLLDADLVLQYVPYPIPKLVTQLYWHETTAQDAALSWLRGLIVETASAI